MRLRFIAAAFILLSGTAQPATAPSVTLEWTSPTKRILIIEPDVQLGELSAGGVMEPRADWTQAAQGFIDRYITARVGQSGAEVAKADRATPRDIQLMKLHGIVGRAILTHVYGDSLKLPTKSTPRDWTLGPGTSEMRDRYGADYALFVFVRDSYSSAERRALQVVGVLAALALGGGVIPSGGAQVGFASLVDLRTGNIVWFNRLANVSGDLRTEEPAKRSVDELLKDLPI